MRFIHILQSGLLCWLMLNITSCRERGCTDPNASNYSESAEYDDGSCQYEALTDELKIAFRETYTDIAHANYQDAYLAALELEEIVEIFVLNPTIPGLEACKEKWVLAHIPYSQTEVFRHAQGPIDDLTTNYADRINAWEMEPAYIDHLRDSARTGLIHDTVDIPTIDQQLLIDLNKQGNEKYITLGFHVIEFMLWGEDDPFIEDQFPGNRPYTDFVDGDTNETLATRRRTLLKAATNQLVNDLKKVADHWAKGKSSAYRNRFLDFNPRKTTRLAMTGLVGFGQYELGLNRISGTLDGVDPNREESKFSDNTSRDIYFNTLGLRNVLIGRYGRSDSTYVEGTSLMDVFEEFDANEAQIISGLMDSLMIKAKTLPSPYDYHVSLEMGSRIGPISDYQETLTKFGDRITQLSIEMQMGISKDLPD